MLKTCPKFPIVLAIVTFITIGLILYFSYKSYETRPPARIEVREYVPGEYDWLLNGEAFKAYLDVYTGRDSKRKEIYTKLLDYYISEYIMKDSLNKQQKGAEYYFEYKIY